MLKQGPFNMDLNSTQTLKQCCMSVGIRHSDKTNQLKARRSKEAIFYVGNEATYIGKFFLINCGDITVISLHLSLCFSPWKSETLVTGEFWKFTVWIFRGVFPVKIKRWPRDISVIKPWNNDSHGETWLLITVIFWNTLWIKGHGYIVKIFL